jgi:cysteinyl-tRNA synthetase
MDDDLGVPAALAVLHERVTEGNRLLSGGSTDELAVVLADVRKMLAVLGCDPLSEQWASGSADDLHDVVDALVQSALEDRQTARANKDFAAADAIRDRLLAAGIAIEDTADGPRWSLAKDAE